MKIKKQIAVCRKINLFSGVMMLIFFAGFFIRGLFLFVATIGWAITMIIGGLWEFNFNRYVFPPRARVGDLIDKSTFYGRANGLFWIILGSMIVTAAIAIGLKLAP